MTVCEVAIEAISHACLEKHFGEPWRNKYRIALGGLSDNPLKKYLEMHPEIKKITFALDNDYGAKLPDGSPVPNWGQQAAEKFTAKYTQLGYTTDIEKPLAKDWNDELLNIQFIERVTKEKAAEKARQQEEVKEGNLPQTKAKDLEKEMPDKTEDELNDNSSVEVYEIYEEELVQ